MVGGVCGLDWFDRHGFGIHARASTRRVVVDIVFLSGWKDGGVLLAAWCARCSVCVWEGNGCHSGTVALAHVAVHGCVHTRVLVGCMSRRVADAVRSVVKVCCIVFCNWLPRSQLLY